MRRKNNLILQILWKVFQMLPNMAFILVLLLFEGCRRDNAPIGTNNNTSIKDPHLMQITHATVLSLTDNGKAGIVKKITGVNAIYVFPEGQIIEETPNDGSMIKLKLSSTARSYAFQKMNASLEVIISGTRSNFIIPKRLEALHDWAISDDGTRIACLRVLSQETPEHKARNNGSLEIWSLPFGEKPDASTIVTIYGSGFIAANGDLSRLAVQSVASTGNAAYLKLYAFHQDRSEFEAIFENNESPLQFTFPKIMNTWIWVASSNGIVGWNGREQKVFQGYLRENLVFSPNGDHLLLYRTEPSSNSSQVKILLRLFDLRQLKEIKQKIFKSQSPFKSFFSLDEKLQLYEIQLNEMETPNITEIDW